MADREVHETIDGETVVMKLANASHSLEGADAAEGADFR